MGLRAFIFVGLLLASEISGGGRAETEEIEESYGVKRQPDPPWGGGYSLGRRHRGRYDGGSRCGGHGCCDRGGSFCRCCVSAAEAEAYAASQVEAKPQN